MSIQRTIGPKAQLLESTGYSPFKVRNPFVKMHYTDLSTTPVIEYSDSLSLALESPRPTNRFLVGRSPD